MLKTALAAAAMAMVALTAAGPAAQAQSKPAGAMAGAEIEPYFSGRRLYADTPSGKTWLIDYNKGGTFKGVVERGEDSGKWWVKGDTLCRKWGAWEKANHGYDRHEKSERCFWIVVEEAANRLHFYKEDGKLYRTWRLK